MSLIKTIVSTALSYIGQEETAGNSGFKNLWYAKLMSAMGWLKGQAWCAYTGKAIWYNAFLVDDPAGAKLILKYATGSALGTYNAFKKSKEFHVQAAPTLGALVIYIEGDGPFGHEGVVTWVHPTLESFKFVSGNTSKAGSREGTTVLEKIDYTHGPRPARGLKILGFVSPIRIAQE